MDHVRNDCPSLHCHGKHVSLLTSTLSSEQICAAQPHRAISMAGLTACFFLCSLTRLSSIVVELESNVGIHYVSGVCYAWLWLLNNDRTVICPLIPVSVVQEICRTSRSGIVLSEMREKSGLKSLTEVAHTHSFTRILLSNTHVAFDDISLLSRWSDVHAYQ